MSLSDSTIIAAGKKTGPSVAGGGIGLAGSYHIATRILEKTAMSAEDQQLILMYVVLPILGAITPWATKRLRRWFGDSRERGEDRGSA